MILRMILEWIAQQHSSSLLQYFS